MKYEYQLSSVNLSQLETEIKNSTITIALDYIDYSQPNLDLYFKANLSSAEETQLTSIINSHEPQEQEDNIQEVLITGQPTLSAFASKFYGDKALFKRFTGITQELTTGENSFTYTIPYTWVKIIGIQVINCEALDTVDFEVLDSENGDYSGTSNLKLNQFGFSLNLSKDFYEHVTNYDADLYQGMQLKFTYNSISNKTIGVNFNLNEVK